MTNALPTKKIYKKIGNPMISDSERLSKAIGKEVQPWLVAVARNEISGTPDDLICELLAIKAEDLVELKESEVYRDVRLILGSEHATRTSEIDANYDKLEEMALTHLTKVMKMNKDPEFSLKVAAMANRAQRRLTTSSKTIDPALGQTVIPLKLSRQTIVNINAGNITVDPGRKSGSLIVENPTFGEVSEFLGTTSALPGQEAAELTQLVSTRDIEDYFNGKDSSWSDEVLNKWKD